MGISFVRCATTSGKRDASARAQDTGALRRGVADVEGGCHQPVGARDVDLKLDLPAHAIRAAVCQPCEAEPELEVTEPFGQRRSSGRRRLDRWLRLGLGLRDHHLALFFHRRKPGDGAVDHCRALLILLLHLPCSWRPPLRARRSPFLASLSALRLRSCALPSARTSPGCGLACVWV